MTDATYPILLIPKGMIQHLQQIPSRPSPPNRSLTSPPQFAETLPQRLEPEYIKNFIVNTIAAVAIGALLSLFNLASIGIPVIFISLSLLVIYCINHVQQYPLRKRRYQRKLQRYQRKQRQYDKAVKEADIARQEYNAAIAQWKKQTELLLQPVWAELKCTQSPGHNSRYRSGYSERSFEESLRRRFGDRIHTGCTLHNPKYNREYPYTADFAYIDKSLKLHIDIEIDEPYVYNKNILTHCVGSDDERNCIFLERGWVVLRFAEKQVIRYSRQCCQTIEDVIAAFQGQQSYREISFPPAIKHWTTEEARKMMLERYRQSYL